MNTSTLWALSLSEASDGLANGNFTSRDLTEALLDRIHRVEPLFHAFATLSPEVARADADRADADRASGRRSGPLMGIPLALKDAIDDVETPAKFGNPVLHANRAGAPSTIANRLRSAGAVSLGKLTLSEGVWVQHHQSVPEPRNPYSKDHWTGNSSSGSGVALATGMCMGSIGTDTGGSIRLPSGCCGITGLKPTLGRISLHGVHPLAPSFDTAGPMARTARDVALLMDAVAGFDPNDPTSLTAPVEKCAIIGTPNIKGLRLGVPAAQISAATTTVQTSVADAIKVFAALGADIVPVTLPEPEPVILAWGVILSAEAAKVHRDSYPAHADLYGPALTSLIERGYQQSTADLAGAMTVIRRHRDCMSAAFTPVDAVLLPALPVGGPSNAFMNSFASDQASSQTIGRYTVPFNTSGFPTLTVPCGKTPEGVPLGLQICAAPLSEPLLCRIGAAYQDNTDWHGVASQA